LKATIHKMLSREKLLRVFPKSYAKSLTFRLPQNLPEPVTAVFFRDDVVTGRVARQALKRVGQEFGASLVFAAHDFTREAAQAVQGAGVILIASTPIDGRFWSDNSLVGVRVSIATNKKRPKLPPRQPVPSAPEEEPNASS
jgi:hypothetical protein